MAAGDAAPVPIDSRGVALSGEATDGVVGVVTSGDGSAPRGVIVSGRQIRDAAGAVSCVVVAQLAGGIAHDLDLRLLPKPCPVVDIAAAPRARRAGGPGAGGFSHRPPVG